MTINHELLYKFLTECRSKYSNSNFWIKNIEKYNSQIFKLYFRYEMEFFCMSKYRLLDFTQNNWWAINASEMFVLISVINYSIFFLKNLMMYFDNEIYG